MLPVWIMAVSSHEATCQSLLFSYGVFPIHEPEHPGDWRRYTRKWLTTENLNGQYAIVAEGPSNMNPQGNNRMEIIDLNTA
jgi:pyruvate kinase